MGIPDHLTCLLRNLYAGQETAVRTRHETMDWFQIGNGVHQGYIMSLCLFNLYVDTSCKMPGWMKHKLESKLPGEISITSDMQMTPPLWQKVGLKLNIQETKIMASGPITSWEIDEETVSDFIFLGAPKSLQMVTAAMKLKDAYSLEGRL